MIDDTFYMRLCLDAAWEHQGRTYPNPPVGALILSPSGRILSIGAHKKAGEAHAELDAVVRALPDDPTLQDLTTPSSRHHHLLTHYRDAFYGHTLYVTLEPCTHHGTTPPCSLLVETLGFSRIVIGTTDPNPEASGSAASLRDIGREVVVGVLESACKKLITPFAKWQKEEPFVYFKLAKTQNGVVTGGTITSLEARRHVHTLREKVDLLVIGGETVRTDRPRLDCRLTGSTYAPDILIYSHRSDFDRSIPLFGIPGRNVYIEDRLERIKAYRNIMIEGGERMLEATRDITDWYLFYTTASFKKGRCLQSRMHFEPLHHRMLEHESLSWYRKESL